MTFRVTAKKIARLLLWLLISLVTLVVLLFVWTNWSGKRRWAATQARIEQAGETLDFRKLLPTAPAEDANLLAIAPLHGITEVIAGDESKGESGAKRHALAGLKWQLGEMKTPGSAGTSLGRKTAFQEWLKMARAAKLADVAADSPQAGQELLAALDAKFPLLKQLADEAIKRPEAMFTPALRDRELPGMLFSLQIPHYTVAQQLGVNLALRARAATAAGDGPTAAKSVVAMLRVAQACKAEPMLIGFLVGLTVEGQAVEVLWDLAEQRALPAQEWQMLQRELERIDLNADLLLAMRGELAVGIGSLEYLEDVMAGRKQAERDLGELFAGVSHHQLRRLPGGLFSHWKSVIADVELRLLIEPLKTDGLRASLVMHDAVKEELVSKSNPLLHPDHIMARLMVPSFVQISRSALMAQARLRQAIAALALERCHLQTGAYPARLEDLVPAFAAVVPVDPCDGKAMRYRTTAAGRYLLWSVAFDGQDDAGKVDAGEPAQTGLMKKPEYQGDWTWQYAPSAK